MDSEPIHTQSRISCRKWKDIRGNKEMINRIINEDDISIDELNRMRTIRNATGFNMSDEELKQFYVEWNNVCHLLRNGKRGHNNVKRV